MSKRERRNKREILENQIQDKQNKIDFFCEKISKLTNEKSELEEQLQEHIAAEAKAREEAENNELIRFIKRNGITKEQIQSLVEKHDNQ